MLSITTKRHIILRREGQNALAVCILLTGLLLLMIEFNASAQGNLLLTPRRIVFEGSKKSIDLNLANIGTDTSTFAISVVQVRMTEDGGFETITEPDPGQLFADKNIRFFPRSVTLGPNESQVVKVQAIRTGELQPGEYRSHFFFRSIPKAKPLGEEDQVKDSGGISIKLTPIFGITIPVILRIGEGSAGISITDVKLQTVNDSIPNLSLVFNRTGNFSVYGDLTVDHVSPQGKVTRVGVANGIAVYTPNLLRRFQFNLNPPEGVSLTSGKIRLTFSSPSDIRPVKYAETVMDLH